MLGLGSNISKTGKLGVHDLGIVTSNLVLKHNYDLSSVHPLSDGAAFFDGTDDYISMSSKIVDTADATYCVWVKSTDVNNAVLFSHSGGATAEGHKNGTFSSNHGTTNKPLLYLNDALYQYWDDSGLADDGKWHHWAIVVDVDDMTACKLYIDGVLQSQSSRATSDSANAYGNLRIGTYTADAATDQFIGGYMCNFGVWTGFLSQPQIKSIMNKNYADLTASETADLVSWWNLDSVTTEVATAVYDNHGGETFGSELLNQPILTGTNWVNTNGTVSDGVGTVAVPADGGYSYFRQNSVSYTEGAMYKATVTVQGTVGKTIRVRSEVGSDNGGLTASAGVITLTGNLQDAEFYFISNDQDDVFAIERNSSDEAYSFDIHSASLKKLNGNTGTLS